MANSDRFPRRCASWDIARIRLTRSRLTFGLVQEREVQVITVVETIEQRTIGVLEHHAATAVVEGRQRGLTKSVWLNG